MGKHYPGHRESGDRLNFDAQLLKINEQLGKTMEAMTRPFVQMVKNMKDMEKTFLSLPAKEPPTPAAQNGLEPSSRKIQIRENNLGR